MSDAAATVSGMGDDVEVVFFADAAAFRAWLEEHHATATELWMGLRRKGHPDRGLTWEDAVPEALCFGWIDSTSYRIDDEARRQRWTPRKPTSNWSAVNIAHVERLLAEGRMHPAGIAAFERRDKSVAGYSYETRRELGADGLAAIAAVPAAQAFWEAAPPSYRRVAGNWVLSAKREQTRADRLATLVADCAAGRLIPPQRYGDEPRWVARAAAASGR
ncbi:MULTISPECIES: YdeI/OmpD-associated family protein [Microbacterium]|uniref:YdeI/OmpD-associated family protein n=1 Tax=Microbacterium aurum TaxID=36805 RepID=UPI001EF4086B|nr:YdeI/OmpD-associated family protein [Microbacterium aurum]MCG7414393.1 YdeI/OmpD-associated family protein [Microbacterium aurum]